MKKIFRKLACCSFLSIASIGCFDAEARVTKEVAEAVLPFLMEAAGIPGDEEDTEGRTTETANTRYYKKEKIQAILDMIYTDEGQQQMVNWAVDDQKPNILAGDGGPFREEWPEQSANTVHGDEKLFQILFPCKTGTFTSFAAHNSRLGYYALKYGLVKLVGATVFDLDQIAELKTNPQIRRERTTLEDILTRLTGETIDLRIAKIIFLLDICDTLDQLKNIYNRVTSKTIAIGMDSILTKYNEYDCRPVPATMAQTRNNEGDCVENLCKHIIAIATQIDSAKYCCDQLPPTVRLSGINHSGITEIQSHKAWVDNLTEAYLSSMTVNCKIQEHMIAFIKQATSPCFKLQLDKELKNVTDSERLKISNGTFENITDVIESIAFYGENHLSERSKDPLQRFAEAMHKISNRQNQFEISVLHTNSYPINTPPNTNSIIEIKESSETPTLNRKVLLAFCDNGHAEIISIQKN